MFINESELSAIVDEAVDGEKRFEEFCKKLDNSPEARNEWERQKSQFLDINV